MNRNRSILAFALVFALAPLTAWAQQNPVVSSFRHSIEGQERNLAAGAEAMPASKYSYKPTPAQMTFGQMVLHVSQATSSVCARITGAKGPSYAGLTMDSPKPRLLAAMKSSFSFCDQELAKVNDSDLATPITLFGNRAVPKAAALIEITDDLADHYSQEAIYLRLNGHLPPTAMRGMGGMGRGRGGM